MKLIVTTTDSIDGCRIVKYIDIVRSSVVVGNDMALTDLFGDGSRKYSLKVNDIYDKAIQALKLKAVSVGADAVVGLHTEFEEIFGKGKTRMVVSMVGTAVNLNSTPQMSEGDTGTKSVSLDTLRRQYLTVSMRRRLEKRGYYLNEGEWNDVLRYSLYDVAPLLYKRYLVVSTQTISKSPLAGRKLLMDNFIPFLQSMEYEEACEVVYSDSVTAPECFCEVVKECNLFNPEKISGMLQPENKHTVIALLDSDKPVYDAVDLMKMKEIADWLNNLPDTGHYIEGRDGLFSKNGTLLVCERGHTSAVELGGHCTEQLEGSGAICNLNVKGITEAEVAAIARFKEKVDVLKMLIK